MPDNGENPPEKGARERSRSESGGLFEGADRSDRDTMLRILEDGVAEAHRKVDSGRVRDAENEKVRIQWVKALGYLAGQYRQLAKDAELEELADRLAELEDLADTSGSASAPTAPGWSR